jgi:predicted transcriptional regulator
MSMTSKVNPHLRQQILNTLANGVTASNNAISVRLSFNYSLRAIQEATQKMTKEGVLTLTKAGRYTYYGIAPLATGATA